MITRPVVADFIRGLMLTGEISTSALRESCRNNGISDGEADIAMREMGIRRVKSAKGSRFQLPNQSKVSSVTAPMAMIPDNRPRALIEAQSVSNGARQLERIFLVRYEFEAEREWRLSFVEAETGADAIRFIIKLFKDNDPRHITAGEVNADTVFRTHLLSVGI